jgi:hypothetical protein
MFQNGQNGNRELAHVHYEIMLPGSNPFDQSTFAFIDPAVFWTPGVNPNAGANGTGLTVLVTPVNDVLDAAGNFNPNGNADGVINTDGPLSESGAFVREGQASILKLGVNTPHTQPLTLRLAFTTGNISNLLVSRLAGDNVITNVDWRANEGVAYITLAATANQATPNTSGFIQLTGLEDDNTQNETLTYSIDAGYLDPGGWVSYGGLLLGPNNAVSVTPVTDAPSLERGVSLRIPALPTAVPPTSVPAGRCSPVKDYVDPAPRRPNNFGQCPTPGPGFLATSRVFCVAVPSAGRKGFGDRRPPPDTRKPRLIGPRSMSDNGYHINPGRVA